MNESHISTPRVGRRPLLTLLLLFLIGDWIGASIVLFLLLIPARVAAHTPPVWGTWAWWVIVVTALVVLWYGHGIRRLEHDGRRVPWDQKFFFSAGVFIGFAAASPPIDTLAGSLLFVHLTQHMLLHMFVPLLLCLGVPLGPLVAGLPGPVKRYVWRPVVRNRAVRAVWTALLSPFAASAQFVAVLYFWLLPPEMDLIAVHDTVDEFAHVTMLVSGLIFWWMILDPRRRPNAPSYPTRLLALTLTMFANIALGAYITLTHHDLYVVYNRLAAPWGIHPMRDQRIGGLITWIDGSMMEVVGALVVFHRWIRDESLRPLSAHARTRRAEERRRAALEPALESVS
jgi:putative membrane protein